MVTQMAMGMTIKTPPKHAAEHLKPYQFKPGNNANPKGRPKKEISITSKVKELLEVEVENIARRAVDELLKPKGKYPTGLFCEILNRTEGRVPGDMPLGYQDNRQYNFIVQSEESRKKVDLLLKGERPVQLLRGGEALQSKSSGIEEVINSRVPQDVKERDEE